MPFNCEDCKVLGARLSNIVNKRLCENCASNKQYKTICKSDVIKNYKLTKIDLENYPYRTVECRNPVYRCASPMILYFELEIKRYFIEKYENIINNVLNIELLDEDIKIENVIKYLKTIKSKKKQNIFEKILNKLEVSLDDLPNKIINKLENAKNSVEYEKIIKYHLREEKLYNYLKQFNQEEYIRLPICIDYIQENKQYRLEQVKSIIDYMLRKQQLVREAINIENIPKKKYSELFNNFINSITDNDLEKLINFIKDKENRFQILTTKLKENSLILRSDSMLCNNYLNGSDRYTIDYIINTMVEMNWFFTNTNYSFYTKKYDNIKKQERYHDYQNYGYIYRNYESDDSDDEFRQEERQEYNKNKSIHAKEEAINEWIHKGKIGIKPPNTLNKMIEDIEKYNKKYHKLKN